MTHTLHRQGSVESLKQDYTVLIADIPFRIYRARLRRKFPGMYAMVKRVLLKLGIVQRLRTTEKREPEQELKGTVALTSREELRSYVKRLKERNTGRSVVVSGLFDEVNSCLKELNICPHTVQLSLGCFGKTELLPSEEVLEMTTMCGHHMVSSRLVEKLVSDAGKGKITREEAAQLMARLCTCGVFNEVRAARTIEVLEADSGNKVIQGVPETS